MKISETPGPRPANTRAARGEATAAYVLSMALGDPGVTPAAALEIQREAVAALQDPAAPAALEVLARQLPLLEGLWHRFAAEALRAKKPDDRARLLRAALQAQQAHARTLALLHGLHLQGRGRAVVDVDDDPDDEDDAGSGLALGQR